MKRLASLVLTLVTAGCAAISPSSPTPSPGPTATPVTVHETVIVTVLVTQLVTPIPSSTPTATLTPIPTLTPAATSLSVTPTGTLLSSGTPGTQAAISTAQTQNATATLPADAGGGVFTTLTRSTDHFSLRCQPDTVTFGVSTLDTNVSQVDLFYRIEDQLGSSISNWVDIGHMTSDQAGNFTMDFPASRVDPDLRSHKAWLDYQFVAISKAGLVLGRSAKIVKQITFTLDCP